MAKDIDTLIDKILDILVDVGQHDERFKLGEWIKYSPSEVQKILKDHKDELEYEQKPIGEWVYADTIAGRRYYRCPNCAKHLLKNPFSVLECLADESEVKWWRFCPRCGCKMFTKDEKPHDNFCQSHGCSLETRQSCCGCTEYFDNKKRME